MEVEDAWGDLGRSLIDEAAGSRAVLLSGDASSTCDLRMKAGSRHLVRVGNVDTRIVVYDMFLKFAKVAAAPTGPHGEAVSLW